MESAVREHPPLRVDSLGGALAARRSCRAFLPDMVPAETLNRVFEFAQGAASWCNSQAWLVHLVEGEDAKHFAAALTERASSGPSAPDIAPPAAYEGVYRDRRRDSGFALYNALGIARDDAVARQRQARENFRFFGAPHVAVISAPKSLGPYGGVDCGGYVATLMLVATSLGVSSIAQAAIAMYADLVHEYLDIDDSRDILCAVSLGYADTKHPANNFVVPRAPLDEVVVRTTPTASANEQ